MWFEKNKKNNRSLRVNINQKYSLQGANPHSSGSDGSSLCRAFVSKLTRPAQPTAIRAVPALCPLQSNKPAFGHKPLHLAIY